MTTEPNKQIILYEDTNGEVKLDVSLENDTVWLSQKQMETVQIEGKREVKREIEFYNLDRNKRISAKSDPKQKETVINLIVNILEG